MGTHAHIGIKEDGVIRYIYNHFDGYPRHLGIILSEYYNTEEKVRELIELGDVSCVYKRVKPNKGEKHSFEHPVRDVTVAYCRDRGEEKRIRETLSMAEFRKTEFNYLFDPKKGGWVLYTRV